jgi:DNA-binding NtrC family response regulator
VQCNAVPGGLLFDELFGHEPGAFSGAFQEKRGCFERADGGFLFLDEIGNLPLDVQKQIIAMLADKSVVRLGGVKPVAADVGLILSTSQDLARKVREGDFLAELWHRIRTGLVDVPPLRAHKLDIPLLVHHFIQVKSIALNLPVIPSLADGEMEKLLEYDWPGNVRELKNAVEKSLLRGQGKLLRFPDLGGELPAAVPPRGVRKTGKIPTLDEVMIAHIRRILEETDGRIEGKGGAAELLGIHYNTLRARMKKLGISFGRDA